jgi:hypothetical protein
MLLPWRKWCAEFSRRGQGTNVGEWQCGAAICPKLKVDRSRQRKVKPTRLTHPDKAGASLICLCVRADPYVGSRRVFDDRQALAGRPGRDLSP